MPLQNRVNPYGELHAVPQRGCWMGNRGIIHNAQKEIITTHKSKVWITCRINTPGLQKAPKGQVFQEGHYSQLFFLDEATAFAAGHRPCAECRRARYNEFKAKWLEANPGLTAVNPPIRKIDAQLHLERMTSDKQKVTFTRKLSSLPQGTLIEYRNKPHLVFGNRLLRWSFSGYSEVKFVPDDSEPVTVLTPKSIVRLFSKGFSPQIHQSAHY